MRNIQLCGAVHASYVAANHTSILEEAHLDVLLGACVRDAIVGELSLSLELNLGNEVGLDRQPQTAHFGGVFRWSL